MGFQLSDMECAIFQKIFGAKMSPNKVSLGAVDPDNEDTVYFSNIATSKKNLLTFDFDFPGCVEEYSVVIAEYKSFSFILVDFEFVAGETILIGLSSKPSAEFVQGKLIDWWHSDNGSPPTRFHIEDERILSPVYVRKLMNNENRPSFLTDAEFDAWLAENLAAAGVKV